MRLTKYIYLNILNCHSRFFIGIKHKTNIQIIKFNTFTTSIMFNEQYAFTFTGFTFTDY